MPSSDHTDYPQRTAEGGLVWACCISEIGPVCAHRILDDAPDGAMRRGDWSVPIGPPAMCSLGTPTQYAR